MTWLLIRVIRLLLWCLALLGHRRVMALGRGMGWFLFHVVPIRKRIVLDNLTHAFPDEDQAWRLRIAQGVYQNLAQVMLETLLVPSMTEAQIDRLVRVHNMEILLDVAAAGRGAVVCFAHIGNWEITAHVGRQRGLRLVAITKQLKGAFNAILHEIRQRSSEELPASGSMNAALQALESGKILGYVVDQHRGKRPVIIDFFGRPAATSPAPALFTLKTGVPVFTAWMTRAADGRYDFRFDGPFEVPDAPTEAERLRLHTQAIASHLEAVIREHPEQWFWVHRRWKVAPDAAATQPASTPG